MRAAALDSGRLERTARQAGTAARGSGARRASAARPPSKLQAAQSVGLTAKAAAGAAGLLALLVLVAVLATGGRGAQLVSLGEDVTDGLTTTFEGARTVVAGGVEGLGLKVSEVRLQGATPAARAEVLAAAGVRPGASITALDLDAVRQRVEQVGWVARARVMRLWPSTIVVAIDQRPLVALWQHAGRVQVIASNGAPVASVDPARFPALPLVVGEGAPTAAAALLPLLSERPRLWSRLQAAVRVDGRRWDLRLKSGAQVLLPEGDEAAALARLEALDRRSGALDLSLERIDLRDPQMTVVRPRQAADPNTNPGGV